MHALNQGHGVGLQNAFPSSGLTFKLRGPRPRTLVHGHKAGLYLTDYSFESFCGLAQALALHERQTFGYVDERYKPNPKAREFFVEIEGDPRRGKSAMSSGGNTFRKNYETKILPILRDTDDAKPRIRVRARTEEECGFDCECDDSRELEVEAVDVGFLRVLAEWHRWEETPMLLSNSQIFETTMFDLLFPLPAFADQHDFMMELPDGDGYRLARGMEPLLSARVQEALSHVTTQTKQEGVKPNRIKIWPTNLPILPRPQVSPGQKSPSKLLLVNFTKPTNLQYRCSKG